MHPNNTQFKHDHQPQKNITTKLLFSVNTSRQPNGKVTLVCGYMMTCSVEQALLLAVITRAMITRARGDLNILF